MEPRGVKSNYFGEDLKRFNSYWYLPSKDELHLIKTSGVGAPNLYSFNYWSSTEHDANNAYSEVLGNYANNYNSFKPKDTAEAIKVRVIRSF